MEYKDLKLTFLTFSEIKEINEIGFAFWGNNGVYPENDLKDIILDGLSYGYKNLKNELIAICIMKKSKEKEVYVYLMAVKKDYQKKGIGKNLLSFAIQNAIENDYTSFKLHVAINNAPALHLYTSLGFKITTLIANYYEENEKERNAFLMSWA